MAEVSGIELNPHRVEYIEGEIRPLRDGIVIRPIKPALSSTIATAWNGKALRGQVLAVGPGEYPNRYNRDRSKVWRSKAFLKTEVKVGDIVELGGFDIGGYTFPQIYLNGEEVLLVTEKDVTGIVQTQH